MNKRTIGMVILTGGIVLLALSLGADLLGIGSNPGMHWKQWAGTAAGLAGALTGVWMLRGKAKQLKKTPKRGIAKM
jgi:hypothetical protein